MLTGEEVVLITDSDNKSIIILSHDKMEYAFEGLYGGFVFKYGDKFADDDEAVNYIKSSKAYFVDVKTFSVSEDEEEYAKKVVMQLPEDVKNEFLVDGEFIRGTTKYIKIEKVQYEYVEVDPVIIKRNSAKKYIIIDFRPKTDGRKHNAEVIRVKLYFDGSGRHPLGSAAIRKIKEFKLKYPNNEIIQKYMYAQQLHYKASVLMLKLVTKAPSISEFLGIQGNPKESKDEDVDIEDILKELEGDVDIFEVSEKQKHKEKKEDTTAVEQQLPKIPSEEELRKIFMNYVKKQGLVPTKLIVFNLPTEYLGSKTKYRKNGEGWEEIKILKIDPAKFRTLRKRFYDVLHKVAFKTLSGWVLRDGANLDDLNEVIKELNELADVSRRIYIIETYMPVTS